MKWLSGFVMIHLVAVTTAVAQIAELVVATGHTGEIGAVIYSPDGRFILSADWNVIKLWSAATGQELRTFKTKSSRSVSFSPDGKRIVTGSQPPKVWDVATGNVINEIETAKLTGGQRSTMSAAFDHNGTRIVTYGGILEEYDFMGKEDLHVCDAVTGERIKSFKYGGTDGILECVAFSKDGRLLLTGTSAMLKATDVRIVDAVTGSVVKVLKGHGGGVFSVCWSPDGKSAVSGGDDSTAILWDVASGNKNRIFKHADGVRHVSFSLDGRFLLTGDGTDAILWDVKTGKQVRKFGGYGEKIISMAISPDSKSIVTGSFEATLRIWNAETGKLIRVMEAPANGVKSVSCSPNGRYLAAGSDKTAKIWDLTSGKPVWSNSNATLVAFTSDSSLLLSDDSTIVLHNMMTGSDAAMLLGIDGDLAVSSDGRTFLFCKWDNETNTRGVTAADILTGKVIRPLKVVNDALAVSVSRDRTIAVTGEGWGNFYEQSGRVTLWDLSYGTKLKEWEYSSLVSSVAIGPDNRHVLVAAGSKACLLDAVTGKEVRCFDDASSIKHVSFSPDGKYVLTGGPVKISLWDAATGHQIRSHHYGFRMDNDNQLSFSKDGRYIIAGDEVSVVLYSVSTGETLCRLYSLGKNDWAVVTPDGRFDASPDGMKLLYYVQGLETLPLESFFDQFYTPNLLARVLSGETFDKITSVDFTKSIKLPPLVKIVSPTEGQSFASDELEITLEVTDQGGGIDEVRLFQNGKLVSEEQRGMKKTAAVGETFTKSYKVLLVSGMNEFRATAFNTDRTEANPYVMTVELKAAQASASLHILAIGLNEYQNPKYKLNYGKADAEAFVQAVENRSQGIFKTIKKQIIHDQQAVRSAIEKGFETVMAEAQPQDAFVFFYAGHGVMSEGDQANPAEFFLAPHDVTQLYGNDEMLMGKGISAKQLKTWCARIKAQKQLVVLDACQSGGAVETFAMRGASEEKAILQLARSAGVVVMASTGTEQFATEFAQLGHGAFTYTLLKGLDGEADGSPKDGKITVKELEAYLGDKLPEITKQYRGAAQYPNSYARGQDFPIGVK